MNRGHTEIETIESFPTYLEYQCERLIPVANLLLTLSIVYLMGFALVDFYQYRSQFQQIVSLRFLAALPLMLLISLLNKPTLKQSSAPIYFLLLVFNSIHLIVCFIFGALIYFVASYYFINDTNFISRVFFQMIAILVFTVIAVIKIKQSAEENYALAKSLHGGLTMTL